MANNNSYKAQCESFVAEWLRKNTFHKCETVALDGYKERNIEFSATVCNEFKIETIKKQNAAQTNTFAKKSLKHKSQFIDEIFYTRKDYEFALEKYLAIVSKKGFEWLFEQIKNGDFGIFKKECVFYIDEARSSMNITVINAVARGICNANAKTAK